jgi:hypothetical protein
MKESKTSRAKNRNIEKEKLSVPVKDIKVEAGQPTFLKALTKIVKKKK